MRAPFKVLLVLAGYLVALMIALGVVGMYIAATSGTDRQASSGMFAFGDSLLFLGVFACAAIPATGAALFFLRPYRVLWRIGATGALAIATTGVAALAAYLRPPDAGVGGLAGAWADLSPLRLLLAPLLAGAFVLSALFAPTRATRLALLGASVLEIVVFVWIALIWLHASR